MLSSLPLDLLILPCSSYGRNIPPPATWSGCLSSASRRRAELPCRGACWPPIEWITMKRGRLLGRFLSPWLRSEEGSGLVARPGALGTEEMNGDVEKGFRNSGRVSTGALRCRPSLPYSRVLKSEVTNLIPRKEAWYGSLALSTVSCLAYPFVGVPCPSVRRGALPCQTWGVVLKRQKPRPHQPGRC